MNQHPARLAPAWLLLAALAPSPARAEEPPKAPTPAPAEAPTLYLTDGGFAAGGLAPSDRPGVIRWQSAAFAEPLEFPVAEAQAIRFPAPPTGLRPAAGAFGFELTGGDVLYGSLVALDDKAAELDAGRIGKVRVERSRLARIFRWGGGSGLIYDGPRGLAGWREIPPVRTNRPEPAQRAVVGVNVIQGLFRAAAPARPFEPPAPAGPPTPPAWRDEAGHPVATADGATLQGDLGLPARFSFDIELSWSGTPDFVVAFAADDAASAARAFRFEVWDGRLVLLRETEQAADLVAIQPVPEGAGRAHLRGLVDQPAGRFVVVAEDGRPRAELTLGGTPGAGLGGLRLTSLRGGLRLEKLRIGQWDGETPAPVIDAATRVELADGTSSRRAIERFDAGSREFVARDDSGETRIPEDRVADIRLGVPAAESSWTVLAIHKDGTRLGGDWLGIDGPNLLLAAPGFAEPLRLPLEAMQVIETRRHDRAEAPKDARVGTLDMEGVRLRGRLVGSGGPPEAGVLAWQPIGAGSPSPIRPGASGRILYNGTPPPPAPARVGVSTRGLAPWVAFGNPIPAQAAQPPKAIAIAAVEVRAEPPAPARPEAPAPKAADEPRKAVAGAGGKTRVIAPAPAPAPAPVAVQGFIMGQAAPVRAVPRDVIQLPQSATRGGSMAARRSLYLRTGDIIPCEVARIDEDGVTFKTEYAKATFVPNDRVKAVELAAEVGPVMQIGKVRRERLLTLPRMQKGSPPTHLIRSKTGDVLRGRIVAMDDETIRVEVRQEEREVPRDRVSRIIWFHADETDPSKKATEPPAAAPPTRVQAVRADGIRLTFVAERVADDAVIGRSDVLGPCEVKVQDLDQLLIGGAVEKEATQLAYQQWKLQDAPEPRSAQADAAPLGNDGTESPLVGQPAPDFTLKLLGGGDFHLADARGQVVILDFWATWCGPCLQAMPQIDKVAHEFEAKGVKLVAVNLQEPPAKITALLERIKLSPTVALDRDGIVAGKYAADAIPQTVIVDRDGKLVRLFVGGGPKFEDRLRDALNAVTAAPQP
ncbi:redoxin domain-containing protein [Tundrisphaera sp. TA3]|uniref:redoxin domain-containing protein n=1 Tax=Tundrisphaera sp. TA3 TaxID=3435775 RepID=UPI003EB932C9